MQRFHAFALALLGASLLAACSSSSDTSEDDDGSSGVTNPSANGSSTSGSGAMGGASSGGAGGATSASGGASSASGGASSASGGAGGAITSSGSGGASSSSGGAGGSSSSSSSSGSGGSSGMDACGTSAANSVWFEIDYSSAFTATNPAWSYSPTPSWGEPEWAPQGNNWPEVWDLYNNINVSNDPIGKLAVVGPSGVLQIMIGLQGLTSYTKAVVCVEGRSVSATASVIFDVYNPLNNCGTSASMAHDWTVHAVAVDLGTCLIPNNNFQAIRVDPTGGSSAIGIKRLRLTLQNAVY